jgi:DNA segregation ATPase FtsK/SpoIIIE-like protein
MIKLESYTDENVFENAKKYIKENLEAGDRCTTSTIQRQFSIGYNKAIRILQMLQNDKIIKLYPDRRNEGVVL